jgi:hypothetical protein
VIGTLVLDREALFGEGQVDASEEDTGDAHLVLRHRREAGQDAGDSYA